MHDKAYGAEGFYIEVDDGARLYVSTSGDQDAPTIIFSTPLAGAIEMWDDVIAHLPEGLRIVRYDTRGLGRSHVSGTAFDIARLGRDVIAIMDALHIERAFFCGVSLGGLTGIWLGAHHPQRFDGLVLANTAASFPPPAMWQDRARDAVQSGMMGLIDPTLDRWFTQDFRQAGGPAIRRVAAMIGETNRNGYAACCKVLETTQLEDQLDKISAPVLVVVGTHDPSTPPVRGEQLAAGIANCQLVTLEASHIPAVEIPDQFAAAIAQFLAAALSAPDDVAADSPADAAPF